MIKYHQKIRGGRSFCNGSRTKGQTISKANYGFLNYSKIRTKFLTTKSTEDAQDSEFRSFFRRIEDTINCFLDLLTFSKVRVSN